MSELSTPHDRFFKEVFARPEAAREFLENYLPLKAATALDLSTLELMKDSFVDVSLRQHLSDLLYRVKLKTGVEAFVYVLFEHKSEWVALQLLRYMVRIWEPIQRAKTGKLPPILPLVLYHGRSAWRVASNFGALIEWGGAEELRPYAPEFQYHLCDLTAVTENEIRGAALLQVALLALKYVFHPELRAHLKEMLRMVAHLQAAEGSALEYLRTVLIYLSAAAEYLTQEDLPAAVQEAPPEREGIMATLAETWIQEGVQQGIRQGRQEGTAALTLRLRRLRLSGGALEGSVEDQIRTLGVEQMEQLCEAHCSSRPLKISQRGWPSTRTRNNLAQSSFDCCT